MCVFVFGLCVKQSLCRIKIVDDVELIVLIARLCVGGGWGSLADRNGSKIHLVIL